MTGALRHAGDMRVTLARNPAFQHARRHALQHYRSRTILTFIPKNGCTSLRVGLARANGVLSDDSDWRWVHQNNETFAADLGDLARADASVVVLRCPHARLASAYLDKIVRRMPVLHQLSQRLDAPIDVDALTFRDFVQLVSKPGILRSDVHWRPQIDFLVFQDYTHWLDFADWNRVGAVIGSLIGVTNLDARDLAGHGRERFEPVGDGPFSDTPAVEIADMRRAGRLPSIRSLYDDDLSKQVAGVFAADLALYAQRCDISNLTFPERAALLTGDAGD